MSAPGPMTDWSVYDSQYSGTAYGDSGGGQSGGSSPANGNVTWGRDQKFFGLSLIGPSGALNTVGLMEAFDETESTNSDFIDVAGTDQLEWELGTPRWSLSVQRMMPRGLDMRQLAIKAYNGAISTVDWRFLPFMVQGDFQYRNPTATDGNGKPTIYEAATWRWHKCFVQTYRAIYIPGTRGKMREEVTLVGAGVTFFENGTKIYESNPYAYSGQFFTSVSNPANPSAFNTLF